MTKLTERYLFSTATDMFCETTNLCVFSFDFFLQNSLTLWNWTIFFFGWKEIENVVRVVQFLAIEFSKLARFQAKNHRFWFD